jgi:hypothetical protein
MGAPGDKAGMSREPATHPATPDGRYFVVRGRLWRLPLWTKTSALP